MKRAVAKKKTPRVRETLTEAYEVRAFREEEEAPTKNTAPAAVEVPHAEPGAFQKIKSGIMGHGEQVVLPDDCQFGDNDLCYVES